jgi:NADH-quinone oxidoreductase subunit A
MSNTLLRIDNVFYYEFVKLGVLLLFCLLLSFFILVLSFLLTNDNPDSQKLSSYECGFEPYEDARNIFDVRFYLTAIIFLVFDLEAVFFFPWCVSLGSITNEGFWFMLDFILELLIGYIYALQVGALDWD